jgi:hypothetical protein
LNKQRKPHNILMWVRLLQFGLLSLTFLTIDARMGRVMKRGVLQNTGPCSQAHYSSLGPARGASIPKVVGSIPTVAKHIFQACPVGIYTQSNITNIFTWVHNTNAEKKQIEMFIFHTIVPIHRCLCISLSRYKMFFWSLNRIY